MSTYPDSRRRRHDPDGRVLAARRRVAELWRAAGLGFTVVWSVLLVLVCAFWVRVTFFPQPGDALPGSLQVLLAPVAVAAAGLVGWSLVCGWRLLMRRASGWDAIVVLGAFAVATAVLVWAPGRFVDGLDSAPSSTASALVALGVASVGTGLLAQRAFRRAAVGLEPTDEDYLDDLEDEYVQDEYVQDEYLPEEVAYAVEYPEGPVEYYPAGRDDPYGPGATQALPAAEDPDPPPEPSPARDSSTAQTDDPGRGDGRPGEGRRY